MSFGLHVHPSYSNGSGPLERSSSLGLAGLGLGAVENDFQFYFQNPTAGHGAANTLRALNRNNNVSPSPSPTHALLQLHNSRLESSTPPLPSLDIHGNIIQSHSQVGGQGQSQSRSRNNSTGSNGNDFSSESLLNDLSNITRNPSGSGSAIVNNDLEQDHHYGNYNYRGFDGLSHDSPSPSPNQQNHHTSLQIPQNSVNNNNNHISHNQVHGGAPHGSGPFNFYNRRFSLSHLQHNNNNSSVNSNYVNYHNSSVVTPAPAPTPIQAPAPLNVFTNEKLLKSQVFIENNSNNSSNVNSTNTSTTQTPNISPPSTPNESSSYSQIADEGSNINQSNVFIHRASRPGRAVRKSAQYVNYGGNDSNSNSAAEDVEKPVAPRQKRKRAGSSNEDKEKDKEKEKPTVGKGKKKKSGRGGLNSSNSSEKLSSGDDEEKNANDAESRRLKYQQKHRESDAKRRQQENLIIHKIHAIMKKGSNPNEAAEEEPSNDPLTSFPSALKSKVGFLTSVLSHLESLYERSNEVTSLKQQVRALSMACTSIPSTVNPSFEQYTYHFTFLKNTMMMISMAIFRRENLLYGVFQDVNEIFLRVSEIPRSSLINQPFLLNGLIAMPGVVLVASRSSTKELEKLTEGQGRRARISFRIFYTNGLVMEIPGTATVIETQSNNTNSNTPAVPYLAPSSSGSPSIYLKSVMYEFIPGDGTVLRKGNGSNANSLQNNGATGTSTGSNSSEKLNNAVSTVLSDYNNIPSPVINATSHSLFNSSPAVSSFISNSASAALDLNTFSLNEKENCHNPSDFSLSVELSSQGRPPSSRDPSAFTVSDWETFFDYHGFVGPRIAKTFTLAKNYAGYEASASSAAGEYAHNSTMDIINALNGSNQSTASPPNKFSPFRNSNNFLSNNINQDFF